MTSSTAGLEALVEDYERSIWQEEASVEYQIDQQPATTPEIENTVLENIDLLHIGLGGKFSSGDCLVPSSMELCETRLSLALLTQFEEDIVEEEASI